MLAIHTAQPQRILSIGLRMRTIACEWERLFWVALRGLDKAASMYLFCLNVFSTVLRSLIAGSFFFFDFIRFSIGSICPSQYWSKWKVKKWNEVFFSCGTTLYSDHEICSRHFADVEPILFSFRIKFYPADPFRLSGNGKIMLYQQLKRDLRLGRLYCSAGEAAALGSLIVQGKCHSIRKKNIYI